MNGFCDLHYHPLTEDGECWACLSEEQRMLDFEDEDESDWLTDPANLRFQAEMRDQGLEAQLETRTPEEDEKLPF